MNTALSNLEITKFLFLYVINSYFGISAGRIYDHMLDLIDKVKVGTTFEINLGDCEDEEAMFNLLKRDGLVSPVFGGILTRCGMDMIATQKSLVETILGTELK